MSCIRIAWALAALLAAAHGRAQSYPTKLIAGDPVDVRARGLSQPLD